MEKNIVILHGWGSKIKKWQGFKKEMEEKNWRVFLPQLPGFGTTRLVKAWDLSDYTDWLKKFLAQRGFKEYLLLGHSFGGSVAIKLTAQKPKGLKGLILVNSAGIRERISFKKSLFLIIAKIGRLIFLLPPFCLLKQPARWLLYTLAREKDYYRANKVMRQTMRRILKEDLKPCFSKIKTSTLIIWGEKDQDTPLKNAYLMKKAISNSQLVVYNNIGHGLPFKKTKKLVQEIINFLK